MTIKHLTQDELEAGLPEILASPRDSGAIKLIVQRPAVNERQSVESGELDVEQGLVGDNWKARGSGAMPDRSAHPDMQLTIMNARAAALVAQDPERWALAGDQFYVDLDLSTENLPAGSRLHIGDAVVEVTAEPHTGCVKFLKRFGRDAMKFVNSELGCKLNLRGINARVIKGGKVTTDDVVVVESRGSQDMEEATPVKTPEAAPSFANAGNRA
jgi:MOSC domain-containing protein YiiM